MIIRDKQDLRKCVKQCIRRAEVTETALMFDAAHGECGVARMLGMSEGSLQEAFERLGVGSPLGERSAVLLAALSAMQLPVHDLDKADAIAKGYDRQAYLSCVLSGMRARRVLAEVSSAQAQDALMMDERFAPLLAADASLFEPGRYGVDYAAAARNLAETARAIRARDVKLERFDAQALAYCLMPLCEDEALVLHVHLDCAAQIEQLFELLKHHPQVRALVSAEPEIELKLIAQAAGKENVLVRLEDLAHLGKAFAALGTRFVPYASHAALPEEMLGRWIRAKEEIWPALCEAYLALARTGYELTREAIEADCEALLCGNMEQLYL